MNTDPNSNNRKISALIVNQWLEQWESIDFSVDQHKRKPDPFFYIFSMSAVDLQKLSDVGQRSTKEGIQRSADLRIQRRHDPKRSEAIRQYVFYGSPYSELTPAERKDKEILNLKKPGWLPTAIVVNILKPGDVRNNKILDVDDSISISDSSKTTATINLPKKYDLAWEPNGSYPIEVIDGQHRLWAFEEKLEDNNFELPVVAFHGLDIGWQAYLFWMINIKPKRINASLAFDLYPLLRTQEWLDVQNKGLSIYRETRAQELTESFWSNPSSPWYHRINMLGESGLRGLITQAGWIRSLLVTFIKSPRSTSKQIGGLFVTTVDNSILPWDRAQQAAFIIFSGRQLNIELLKSNEPWITDFHLHSKENLIIDLDFKLDQSFTSQVSLLSTDIGHRAFLHILNDLCFVKANELDLHSWGFEEKYDATDEEAVKDYVFDLEKNKKISDFVKDLSLQLSKYDWRTNAAPNLSYEQSLLKSAFRGGPGYKSMRDDLLKFLSDKPGITGDATRIVLTHFERK